MAGQFLRKFTKTILLFCNGITGLSLLLACYGSSINNGAYWFIGLFTLATIYLLIVSVLFFIFWLFAKPKLSLISLVFITICFFPLKQIIPLRLSSFSIDRNPETTLRVMSWNVEHFDIIEHKIHPEVKTEMLEQINELNPDIACFQEMVAGDSLKKSINYLPEFQQKLKMPYHYYSYDRRLDFDRWHHFGIIIFSKYPIVNQKTIHADSLNYNSTFQYVDIVKNTDTFRVFNIHLQTLRFSIDNRKYLDNPGINGETDLVESKSIIAKFKKGYIKRHRQSDWIKRTLAKSPYPNILCGDFNDVPNSYAYKTIGENMINAFVAKGAGIGNTYAGISPTLRIDNIFVDPRFDVQQYCRIKRKLSDHYPIVTDLKYK